MIMIPKKILLVVGGGILEIVIATAMTLGVVQICELVCAASSTAKWRGSILELAMVSAFPLVAAIFWYYLFGWRGYVTRVMTYNRRKRDIIRRALVLFTAVTYNTIALKYLVLFGPDKAVIVLFPCVAVANLLVFPAWNVFWGSAHPEQRDF